MIVNVDKTISIGVCPQALVDVDDGLARIADLFSPRELRAGWDGADDGDDAVGLGELAHGDDVVDHLVGCHPVVVVRHIVGAGHDDHGFGMQVDDISSEAHQHL